MQVSELVPLGIALTNLTSRTLVSSQTIRDTMGIKSGNSINKKLFYLKNCRKKSD
jgi:hypothetical protein